MISGDFIRPSSLFASLAGDVYIDNGYTHNRIDKSIRSTANISTILNINGSCYGLFIDNNATLYSSLENLHQVMKTSLNDDSNITIIAAGNGTPALSSNTLDSPHGIFVDTNFNLYVADFGNNRIQLFQSDKTNGTTVAGNGTPSTIALTRPTDVVLDGQGYLFIVDSYNHRIVGSGPNGFRCVAGCSMTNGSAATQLNYPQSMAFDRFGNIFVTDRDNNRIQKFLLQTNSCGK